MRKGGASRAGDSRRLNACRCRLEQMKVGLGLETKGVVYICWAAGARLMYLTIGMCSFMGREYILGPVVLHG